MVLEWCAKGDLYEAIYSKLRSPLSEDTIRRYTRQLVEAVAYLHS